MSVFGNSSVLEDAVLEDGELDMNAVLTSLDESCTADMLAHMDETALNEFVNSAECETLITEGKLNRKTIIKINKNDDLARRRKLAAYQIAKEKNDILWKKLVQNRIKERELINKIMDKYGSKGELLAKKSQKNFVSGKSNSAVVKSAIDKSRQRELNNGKAGRI